MRLPAPPVLARHAQPAAGGGDVGLVFGEPFGGHPGAGRVQVQRLPPIARPLGVAQPRQHRRHVVEAERPADEAMQHEAVAEGGGRGGHARSLHYVRARVTPLPPGGRRGNGCRLPVVGCRRGTELGLLSSPCRGGPSRTNRHRRPFSIFRRPIPSIRFIPVYPGLSRFIPVYPGLFRSILVYSGLSRFIPVYSGPSRPVPVAAGRNRAHSVERRPSTPFGPRSPPRRGQWRTCLNRYRIFPIPSTPAVSDAGAAVARRHRHRRAGARGRRFLPPLSSSPPPFQGGLYRKVTSTRYCARHAAAPATPGTGAVDKPPGIRLARQRFAAHGSSQPRPSCGTKFGS